MKEMLLDFLTGLKFVLCIVGILLVCVLLLAAAFALGAWFLLAAFVFAVWAIGHHDRRMF